MAKAKRKPRRASRPSAKSRAAALKRLGPHYQRISRITDQVFSEPDLTTIAHTAHNEPLAIAACAVLAGLAEVVFGELESLKARVKQLKSRSK